MRPSATMQVAGLTWRQKSHDHWWAQSGEIRFDAKHVNRLWRVTISDVLLAVSPDLCESIQSAVDVAVSSLRMVADKLEAHRGQPMQAVALDAPKHRGLVGRLLDRFRRNVQAPKKQAPGSIAAVVRTDSEVGAFIRKNAASIQMNYVDVGVGIVDWLRESGIAVKTLIARPGPAPKAPEPHTTQSYREE